MDQMTTTILSPEGWVIVFLATYAVVRVCLIHMFLNKRK